MVVLSTRHLVIQIELLSRDGAALVVECSSHNPVRQSGRRNVEVPLTTVIKDIEERILTDARKIGCFLMIAVTVIVAPFGEPVT